MISPKSLMKIATTASVVAMTVSVAVVPAYAMQDIAIEDTPSSFAATVDDAQNSSNSMPDNPNATLPETVSENISDDSTMVSQNLAVTPEGDVQDIETGEVVTDPQLIGTQDQQPDPLAKTDGKSFIPVSVSDVKDAVKQPVKQSSSKVKSTVQLARFDGNQYGAHWGTYNNTKAFFDYKNNLFVQQAKGVVDVSSWQNDIDWAKAKADGAEGAIIRLGYGWGNSADKKAQRNINECKRLGIPFGIYWYSYAYDANCARAEGNDVVAKLRQMGVDPNDLRYPVFYDLEQWSWAGHTPPTDPNVYNGIADAWYNALQSGGYQNLGVYSYTNYLNGPLNSASIHAKTRWVAQYGAQMGFTAFSTNDRGWQYTSSGQINGISGSVDMNAFGNKEFKSSVDLTWVIRAEDIAVGAAVEANTQALEYKWMSYDVNAGVWKTIADWSSSNWAGWADNEGTYWLHCEVRDANSKQKIDEQTIAFAYAPGSGRINGTYAGYEKNGILLGVNSDNPRGNYQIKIYDTQKKTWVAGWKGQWARWYPKKGIYWTHFELYTSNGLLTETRTYAFGV
ncbi:1,4-beta-N-acetylmuramidase [Bifidobacterium adolescentis]|uniref:1,4-beta-N-acetylmuramidase n=1 Tax=Bifidobacterium adolescentis (strain ATCC 15703 / DSM 20083 / NCTC 11814 / E194a) TaxID=367928 RepID=A1A3K9_BIFAA|nr:glycoside hydrolase family 25 protein [Bifidobacterium adolescentis]MCT6789983.1 glycoside hydrolase family 25 protein [Bifidobacterium adolescentis]NRD15648.1 1,4-beta-N-acetylmuramidase [Bifidobacterium adolescentis]OSG97081.1 1,4-beta-N-acetylmuramidase [Bifidobacterium adolescentis]SPU23018.1 1,4-beta-N-acetylmuramidase [Bifidobacterium adolescentis]BAF40292.1 1,4-beta-N-acetylmuramidase [Bifidobacterium adolescentis ATCC 15703]